MIRDLNGSIILAHIDPAPDIDLSGELLITADFRGCDLRRARFVGAVLIGADFADADLTGAEFTGANVDLADFSGARLGLVVGLGEEAYAAAAD